MYLNGESMNRDGKADLEQGFLAAAAEIGKRGMDKLACIWGSYLGEEVR